MSILIKGMEMPKESWVCPCHDGETGYCQVTNMGCYDYIPKDCPLVEIPTPHGDLVDFNEIELTWYEDADGIHQECSAPTIIESEE